MRPHPEITRYLDSRIVAGDFPSAVYLVAERDVIEFLGAVGNAVVEPQKIQAAIDTIYDLASLTKVLVATLLVARLIDAGTVSPDQRLGEHFAEFDTPATGDVTLGDLLTHVSGFRSWLPFYLLADRRSAIPEIIAGTPPERPRGSKVVYSDLNFLMLTFLVEKIGGRRIDDLARTEIFEPLGLTDTFYNPPAGLRPRIAASEAGNVFEMKTCLEQGFDLGQRRSAFREQVIWGEVHDGNCWFMDGVSGHAGLFSTAVETFAIARQFIAPASGLLTPETCAMFRVNRTEGLNEARSIGFQLASTPESSASAALAPDSFGHLGFTGTSLWIEPSTERIFILLTNRTHARPLPFVVINPARRRFHELAADALASR